MFSGIIESVQPLLQTHQGQGSLIRFDIKKPIEFNDLKVGDSIAVNGICLTLEAFSPDWLRFALAAETLRVLGQDKETAHQLVGRRFNLERSLRFGDRLHGHLVTGHVDSVGRVVRSELSGENLFLDIEMADSLKPYVWQKGSITINGVSLTVNEVRDRQISVCLIPETQKRTNLGDYQVGERVTLEPDYFAKGLAHLLRENFQRSPQFLEDL